MNIQDKINEAIRESPEACYLLLRKLNYDFSLAPGSLFDLFFKKNNSKYLYRIADDLKFNENIIPDILWANLNYKHSFEIYDKIKGPHILSILFNNISKNGYYSYEIARRLNFDLNKIPQEIMEGIAKSDSYSMYFVHKSKINLSNMPKKLYNRVCKNMDYAVEISNELNWDINIIPKEIFKTILSSPRCCYSFASKIVNDLNSIPECIIKGISKSSNYSCDFAVSIDLEKYSIPQIIIDSIVKDVNYSYNFIDRLFHIGKDHKYIFSKTPKEIITTISKNNNYCLLLERRFGNNLPKEILDKIQNMDNTIPKPLTPLRPLKSLRPLNQLKPIKSIISNTIKT